MSQHLVMYLIDDDEEDIKDSAALEEFAREVRGGFHESAAFCTHFQIDNLRRVHLTRLVRENIIKMLEDLEG